MLWNVSTLLLSRHNIFEKLTELRLRQSLSVAFEVASLLWLLWLALRWHWHWH
jgi:hypothetical protein